MFLNCITGFKNIFKKIRILEKTWYQFDLGTLIEFLIFTDPWIGSILLDWHSKDIFVPICKFLGIWNFQHNTNQLRSHVEYWV